MTERIRWIHLCSRGTYGALRIQAELCDEGIRVGRKRLPRLMLAATKIGNTTPAVNRVRRVLEAQDNAVLVFHANGGGLAMGKAVAQGQLAGVLDFTTIEWSNEFYTGVRGAGLNKLEAVARASTPR